MTDSKSEVFLSKSDDRPLLVVRAKLVRVIVGSLIWLGALGTLLIIDLLGPPSPHGAPDYRASTAITLAIFMTVSPPCFYWARHALRATLTAEYLHVRVPGWLVRTIVIPLRDIRRVSVEKRFVSRGRFGGYYRDFLIINYDANKQVMLRIIAYHSRDLWKLLTTLEQLAPHIKFDANIRRFLYG